MQRVCVWVDEDSECYTHDTSHTLKSICHHAWIAQQTCFETPPFLPLSLSTVLSLSFSPCLSIYFFFLSLSLHLLFPFLNLKGACVYSIFIILGGTVDRWDTCTITRAQHYLFQADRVKNTLSILSLTVSLLRKGDIILWRQLLFWTGSTDLLTKSFYNLIFTTENISPCNNRRHFVEMQTTISSLFETKLDGNKEQSSGRTTRTKL